MRINQSYRLSLSLHINVYRNVYTICIQRYLSKTRINQSYSLPFISQLLKRHQWPCDSTGVCVCVLVGEMGVVGEREGEI